MSDPSHDNFPQRVYHIVAAIPYGRLITYGEVAHQVGGLLSRLPEGSKLPWHRVVNRHGAISLSGEDFYRQLHVLQEGGLLLQDSGRFDLDRYRWRPEDVD
ncbi:MGMT family protein [Sodalis glossinidius]|uniref:MGMT family protein n=1 Tax=Sodalis glossinidius TaxID=63612 RepID=UPI0002DDF1D5|nr:MGMT family protein [Sodalis glossinidius]